MRRSMCLIAVASAMLAASAQAEEAGLFKKERLAGLQVPAAEPGEPPTPPVEAPAFQEALAAEGEARTWPGQSLHPGMLGDLPGVCTFTTIVVPQQERFFRLCVANVTQSSGLKIADGDSPRPLNRFYYHYNFYGAIQVDPALPLMNLHRHMIGFEKTLLGGDASVGMRLPFFSMTGSPLFDSGFSGDLSIITKYALVNNAETRNVLSGGLVVTAPTGGTPGLNGGASPLPRSRAVVLQPFAGYIYNATSRLYVHGFHSVLVPTDANEPTFFTNDVGVAMWLYRNPDNKWFHGVVPTVEIHVNTPFNHREPATVIGQTQMLDSVNLTSGFYVMMARSVFGAAVGVPLAYGPHRIEALANYTLRY